MIVSKSHIIYIIITMSCGAGIVALLAWKSLAPTMQKNGFKRDFTKVTLISTLNIANDMVNGISGTTINNIYCKTKDPRKILEINIDLKSKKYISLSPGRSQIVPTFQCIVDSPMVNIFDWNRPSVLSTDLLGGTMKEYNFPNTIYTRVAKISPHTFVFRGYDSTLKDKGQIFFKADVANLEILKKARVTEESYDPAGIATDGSLNYDKTTNYLTFVSFYRNQLFCLDTNLNIVYKSKTIDTVNTLQIKVGSTNSNIITKLSPSRIINGKSVTQNGLLYIISKLRADNENEATFRQNTTVDVYDIKNGTYKTSFYVPELNGATLKDFNILGNKIIILYKDQIALYQIKL